MPSCHLGGFLGIGDRLFAVPWVSLRYDRNDDVFVMKADRNLLKTPRDLIKITGRTCQIRHAYLRSTNIMALNPIGGDVRFGMNSGSWVSLNHKPFATIAIS